MGGDPRESPLPLADACGVADGRGRREESHGIKKVQKGRVRVVGHLCDVLSSVLSLSAKSRFYSPRICAELRGRAASEPAARPVEGAIGAEPKGEIAPAASATARGGATIRVGIAVRAGARGWVMFSVSARARVAVEHIRRTPDEARVAERLKAVRPNGVRVVTNAAIKGVAPHLASRVADGLGR